MRKHKNVYYCATNKNTEVLFQSQSGGAFNVFSDWILNNNGIVYGCILNDKNEVVHIRAIDKKNRNKMYGSKYVQSNLNNTFKSIINDLKSGKKVLFVGIPCQVSGLKKLVLFKKMNIDNLFLIDIICHGVPSPMVWQDFIDNLNNKYCKIENINMRNKKYGWESSVTTFSVNGIEHRDNSYNTLFYLHYITRDSCFDCHFRGLERDSDLTIGDCWGIKKNNPEFYDKNGVSLIMVNTDKGNILLDENKKKFIIHEIDINKYRQQAISYNYSIPEKYNKFWNDYFNFSFNYIAKKYGGKNFHTFVKRKIKKIIKKILKA